MKYAAIICLGLLAGCSGSADVRATNALAIACETAATVLDELKPLRRAGKISPENDERVITAIKIIDPVCGRDSKVDPEDAVSIVDRATGMLKLIYSTVRGQHGTRIHHCNRDQGYWMGQSSYRRGQ